MKKIDLHGINHKDAENIVSSACANLDIPFIVITGNSLKMKDIVRSVVNEFGLTAQPSLHNSGRLIIDARR